MEYERVHCTTIESEYYAVCSREESKVHHHHLHHHLEVVVEEVEEVQCIIDSFYTEAGYCACILYIVVVIRGFTMAARGLVCIIPAGLPGIGGLNFGNIMNNPAFMNMVYSYIHTSVL